MKSYKRLLSVLLVVVSLFAVFSIPVSAESVQVPSYYITQWANRNGTITGPFTYFINDSFTATNGQAFYLPQGNSFTYHTSFSADSGGFLISKGADADVSLNQLYFALEKVTSTNSSHISWEWLPNEFRVLLTFEDGTQQYIDDINYSNLNQTFDLNFKFKPDKNVTKIEVIYSYTNTSAHADFWIRFGANFGAKFNLSVDQQSEEAGLLSGITTWISNLFDKIVAGFEAMGDGFVSVVNKLTSGFANIVSKLTEGFSNMVSQLSEGFLNVCNELVYWFNDLINNVIELPSKIWNLISEGLKTLFVPEPEFVQDYSEDWDTLLSSRFGALYQSVGFIHRFIERVNFNATTGVVSIPSVSLNAVGIPFTFGGYTVDVVPDGFEFLATSCKTVSYFIVIFCFINAIRKRYDEVMGVEQ